MSSELTPAKTGGKIILRHLATAHVDVVSPRISPGSRRGPSAPPFNASLTNPLLRAVAP